MLKLHGVTISKPSGEWIISVLINGDKSGIYLAPEPEDCEFMDANQITEYNEILKFELNIEKFYGNDMISILRFQKIINESVALLESLSAKWIGKDFRDYAKENISISF